VPLVVILLLVLLDGRRSIWSCCPPHPLPSASPARGLAERGAGEIRSGAVQRGRASAMAWWRRSCTGAPPLLRVGALPKRARVGGAMANHRMNSGRGLPTHPREKGLEGGSRGWSRGFAGLRFFALSPYFFSRGSSRGSAGVALSVHSSVILDLDLPGTTA
jgi:hypothetical protein